MIGDAVTRACPAKLNLCLDVLGPRPDGFHALDSVMVPLAWGDTLQMRHVGRDDRPTKLTVVDLRVPAPTRRPDESRLSRRGAIETALSRDVDRGSTPPHNPSGLGPAIEPIPTGSKNLVCRAVDELKQAARIHGGIEATLWKRVPSAAGLGGGSSDAAAALIAAQTLLGLELTTDTLIAIAARIGSDVPFFLLGGPARILGRGETLRRLDDEIATALIGRPVVVIRPPVGLSTPAVFGRWRRLVSRPVVTAADAQSDSVTTWMEGVRRRGLPRTAEVSAPSRVRQPFNRLEPAAAGLTSWIDVVLEHVAAMGMPGGMSGSGSACYALPGTVERAVRLAVGLRQQLGVMTIVTRIAGSPRSSSDVS